MAAISKMIFFYRSLSNIIEYDTIYHEKSKILSSLAYTCVTIRISFSYYIAIYIIQCSKNIADEKIL